MADTFTELNPGTGGSFMDESSITYAGSPTDRHRPRIIIAGDTGQGELAKVINSVPASTDYGLVIRPIQYAKPYPGTAINEFGSATLVSDESETTVASYTVPSSSTLYLTGFSASGNINGTFNLYINGVKKMVGRTTAAALNLDMSFLTIPPAVATTMTVAVKIIHHNVGLQGDFEATIIGYVV